MPAWSLQPLTYTTPPFAAVSGIVEQDKATLMTSEEEVEDAIQHPRKKDFVGPYWAMFAVAVFLAALIGLSFVWWKKHQRRLERGYYNELRPVSNYQRWRERQATKLLKTSTANSSERTSTTQTRRGSESQKSDLVQNGEPSSSSPVPVRK